MLLLVSQIIVTKDKLVATSLATNFILENSYKFTRYFSIRYEL